MAVFRSCVVFLTCAVALTSCQKAPGGEDVVQAKDFEITTSEFDQALSSIGGTPETNTQSVRRQILETLIDQKLLANQAMAGKLDRVPMVMRNIEASKRAILAQAYLQAHQQRSPVIAPAAIRQFYDENPAVFSHRRVTTVSEVSLNGEAPDVEKYKTIFVNSDGSLSDLLNSLRSDGHPGILMTSIRLPEAFDKATAEHFAALKPGASVVYGLAGAYYFAVVKSVEDAPVDLAAATPIITNMLTERARIQGVKTDLLRLRSTAAIKYVTKSLTP